MKDVNSASGAKGSQGRNRLMAIDYLKAAAIIFVILDHILSKRMTENIWGPFWIDMAVPIFMILSGFTYSMSADRHGISSIREYFNWKPMSAKLSRLLFPYAVTVALEVALFTLFKPKTLGALIKGIATGGWGPGSYYFPMLIQLLILFPVIFLLFRRSPIAAVAASFIFHIGYDIFASTLPLSDVLYKLLIFRYTAFIAMGMVLYHYKDRVTDKIRLLAPLAALSALYIWMCNYQGYIPSIFSRWNTTSLPTIFLSFALVVLGLRYLEAENGSWLTNLACIIGRSSYHIFFVQMVYFRANLGDDWMLTPLHLAVCCTAGVAFYHFEIFTKNYLEKYKVERYAVKSQ
jgi:peptidoglycan/LPS O-acetylase OafA/YrhL